MSDEAPLNIAQRMHAVMADVGGIERTTSEGVNYKFRSIEQIAPAVQAALIEHGVIVLPVDVSVLDTVERDRGSGKTPQRVVTLRVAYHLINVDNPADRLEAAMIGESADFGAKTVTQALTFVYKCLWLQALCIGDPADDADTIPDRNDGDVQIVHDWPAEAEQVDSLRVALSFVPEQHKARFLDWWQRIEVGSLKTGRVNGRHVPAVLAVIEMLAALEDDATSSEEAAQQPPAVTKAARATSSAAKASERPVTNVAGPDEMPMGDIDEAERARAKLDPVEPTG